MAEIKKKKTLEDFFAQTPKVREEYVTAPEKEAAVVEHFEDERVINEARGKDTVVTQKGKNAVVESGALEVSGIVPKNNTPKPMATAAEEIAPEVQAPSLRDSIRSDMPQRQVATEAPAPTTAPKKEESSFPWDRALIGATPLLVGLLTGNKTEGVQVAGNHLVKDEGDLYKRERDLNAKLAEMKQKKEEGVGGSKRFVAQNIALNDGTNVKATFDSFTGKYLMPDGQEIPSNFIRSGYAVNPEEFDRRKVVSSDFKRADADYLGQNTKVDPTTGELGIIRNGQITPVMGQDSGQLNKRQDDEIKSAQKEFTSSQPYKDAAQSLSLAPVVSSLLDAVDRNNDPNSIAGNSVVLTMIRQAQRVGVASDRDAAAMGGTQSWEESINRITEKLLGSGVPLTKRDIADLREISSIYTKRSKEMLSGYYAEKRGSFASRINVDPSIIDQHIGAEVRPYLNTAEKPIKAKNAPTQVQYGGQTWTSRNRTESMPFVLNGAVNFAEPKLWEQIKKENPSAKRLDR